MASRKEEGIVGVRLVCLNRGSVKATTVEALEAIARKNGLPSVKYVTGHLSSADGRCTAVKWLMEETSDDVIMCDDSVVPPQDVLGLASHGLEIVGAPTFLMSEHVNVPFLNAYTWGKTSNGHYGCVPFEGQFTRRGIHEAYRIGTGCFFAARKVFKAIYDAGKLPFAFPTDAWGVHVGSEDFWFSDLARELGFKIHADFDRVCEHFSTVGLWRQHNGQVKAVVEGALKLAAQFSKGELEEMRRTMFGEVAQAKPASTLIH